MLKLNTLNCQSNYVEITEILTNIPKFNASNKKKKEFWLKLIRIFLFIFWRHLQLDSIYRKYSFSNPMPLHWIIAVEPSSITLNLTSVISSAMWIAVWVCNVSGSVHRTQLIPRDNAIKMISWSCTCVSTQLPTFMHFITSSAAFLPVSNALSLREPSADPPSIQFVVVSHPILN